MFERLQNMKVHNYKKNVITQNYVSKWLFPYRKKKTISENFGMDMFIHVQKISNFSDLFKKLFYLIFICLNKLIRKMEMIFFFKSVPVPYWIFEMEISEKFDMVLNFEPYTEYLQEKKHRGLVLKQSRNQ